MTRRVRPAAMNRRLFSVCKALAVVALPLAALAQQTTKLFGIKIPPSILLRADRIIE